MKKYREPRNTEFTPPTVRVSLIEKGSGLDRAEKVLAAQNTEVARAAMAAVDAERTKLAPSIEAARSALVKFHAWERDNKPDLTMLRSLGFDGARGVVDEATRVRAANRVEGLFKTLQWTRDALVTAEPRADALKPSDLDGARMTHDGPGVKAYDELPYAATAKIQLDVERAIRTAGALDKLLGEVQNAVTNLAAALERAKKVRAQEAAVPGAVPASGSIRDPQEIARAKAANPNVPLQTTADADFTGYEAQDRPLRQMTDYNIEEN